MVGMGGEIAPAIKIAYTAVALLVAVVYLLHYDPSNFLWFSDIALLVTAVALWLENPLLVSTMAVGVLLPELFWNVGFFTRLLTGFHLSGLTDYMFDPERPLFLRGLSLFHVIVPAVLVYALFKLGYDPRALWAQTALAWLVLPLSYRLAPPSENVNWVRGLSNKPQQRLPSLVYLALVMIAFPVLVYAPTHFILQAFFETAATSFRS